MALSPLLIEVWVEYAVGMGFLLLRFYARWKTVGFRNFWIGDLFAGLAALIWSVETTFIYLLRTYGNTVGLTPETAMLVPDSEVPRLTLGSKLAFINWFLYISFIWCLKVVLLSLYQKITMNLWQHKIVKYMYAFTGLTWLACILCHLLICLPVPRGWQVKPYPGDECTIRRVDYPVIAALNVITDLAIMSIPLPILFIAKIPLHRKLILGLLFGSGIFVIICTIVRAYYSLHSMQDLQIALGWASRETCVASIAVSAPSIKPLFNGRRWFKGGSGTGRSHNGGGVGGGSVASTQATAVERGGSVGGGGGGGGGIGMGTGAGAGAAARKPSLASRSSGGAKSLAMAMAPATAAATAIAPPTTTMTTTPRFSLGDVSTSSSAPSPSASTSPTKNFCAPCGSASAPLPPHLQPMQHTEAHPGTAASASASVVGSVDSFCDGSSSSSGGGCGVGKGRGGGGGGRDEGEGEGCSDGAPGSGARMSYLEALGLGPPLGGLGASAVSGSGGGAGTGARGGGGGGGGAAAAAGKEGV